MRSARLALLLLCLAPAVTASAQGFREETIKAIDGNRGDTNFDPRDLSGIWMLTRNDHTLGTPAPPLTPAGVAAKAGRIADRDGGIGNAPWYTCNPMGFPRLMNDD